MIIDEVNQKEEHDTTTNDREGDREDGTRILGWIRSDVVVIPIASVGFLGQFDYLITCRHFCRSSPSLKHVVIQSLCTLQSR